MLGEAFLLIFGPPLAPRRNCESDVVVFWYEFRRFHTLEVHRILELNKSTVHHSTSPYVVISQAELSLLKDFPGPPAHRHMPVFQWMVAFYLEGLEEGRFLQPVSLTT